MLKRQNCHVSDNPKGSVQRSSGPACMAQCRACQAQSTITQQQGHGTVFTDAHPVQHLTLLLPLHQQGMAVPIRTWPTSVICTGVVAGVV